MLSKDEQQYEGAWAVETQMGDGLRVKRRVELMGVGSARRRRVQPTAAASPACERTRFQKVSRQTGLAVLTQSSQLRKVNAGEYTQALLRYYVRD